MPMGFFHIVSFATNPCNVSNEGGVRNGMKMNGLRIVGDKLQFKYNFIEYIHFIYLIFVVFVVVV